MATLKDAEKYYHKGQSAIDRTITKSLKDSNETVYGARAVNKQIPKYLRVPTEDWDIATTDDPKNEATKIEKALDKHFGGNFFRVVPALHEGTFKIISNVTNKGIADMTRVDNPIDYKKLGRIRYATLDYQLERIKESLNDPDSAFRHQKDKNTRTRIKIAKKPKSKQLRSIR